VYGIKSRSDDQIVFTLKSGYDGSEDIDTLPMRSPSNSKTHPGTFEISHPEMDSKSAAYSAKHPMTVGTAENRYVPKSVLSSDYDPASTDESIPIRDKTTGTFGVGHPQLDPQGDNYSEYHPMTVGTAEGRYAQNGHDHDNKYVLSASHSHAGFVSSSYVYSVVNSALADYVTTADFEAFKKTLGSTGGSSGGSTGGGSTTEPIKIKSFSISPSTATQGETVSNVTCSWALNRTPAFLTLNGVSIPNTLLSKTLTGSYTSYKKFSLTATDSDGNTAQAEKTLTFYAAEEDTNYYVYYGSASEPSAYTGSFVEGLDNKVQKDVDAIDETISVTMNDGEYFYYCLPADWTAPTFVLNNFVLRFKLVSTVVVDSISYSIYRTPYGGYGNVIFTVS
jgi:hypothetical protein